jgi:hypothetical protein
MDYKYTLVSPDGNDHPTNDESYRYRLLSKGYRDKNPDAEPESVPQTQPALDSSAQDDKKPGVKRG